MTLISITALNIRLTATKSFLPHSAGSRHHLCEWTPHGWCDNWAVYDTQSHTCWTAGWGCPCYTLTQNCRPTQWSQSVANSFWCTRTLLGPWNITLSCTPRIQGFYTCALKVILNAQGQYFMLRLPMISLCRLHGVTLQTHVLNKMCLWNTMSRTHTLTFDLEGWPWSFTT